MSVNVIMFEHLPKNYPMCQYFEDLYASLSDNPLQSINQYVLKDYFLFKRNKLCTPQTTLKDFLF